jgi:hypothetical protein
MVRHYTLSAEDLALVNRRRSDPNRLGFAVMLCYLRFPGRILQQGEQPPPALCTFVAEQLGLDVANFADYAERDQTRREHVLEIQAALGLRPLSPALYRDVAAWLLPTALATDHGPTLVTTLLEELRVRRIVCPPLPAMERLGGSVRARAQRQKLFAKSERAHADEFHSSGKAINEKVRLYAKIGRALIEARTSGADAFAAIEAVLSWSKFESTVAEAQTLAQPEEFDFLALLDERYSSVRKFAPLLLAHFEFHAAPTATELLQALDVLRDLNDSGKRTLPENLPTGFVKPRWQPYVFAAGGVDRHFYEICALSELRDRLRAGDIWVTGSR